jgi:hypothetical protein
MLEPSTIVRAVRPRRPNSRWPLVYFAVFALVFAPAGDEEPVRSNGVARARVDPRIIAPTVSEGMVAGSAKLTARHFQVTERRVQTDSLPRALPASVTGLLLLWAASESAGLWAACRRRLITHRALAPRAPPAFGSI